MNTYGTTEKMRRTRERDQSETKRDRKRSASRKDRDRTRRAQRALKAAR